MIFLGIFLIVFGFVFTSVPLSILTTFNNFDGVSSIMILPFISIFVLAGIFTIVRGFKFIYNHIALKHIENNGTVGTGTFISTKIVNSSSYSPSYHIIFSFVNQKGKTIKITTEATYSFDETNYFASLKTFEIKHNNKLALITQNIDFSLINNNTNSINSYTPRIRQDVVSKTYSPQQQIQIYTCEYCNNSQDKPGKCKCCGAIVKKQK